MPQKKRHRIPQIEQLFGKGEGAAGETTVEVAQSQVGAFHVGSGTFHDVGIADAGLAFGFGETAGNVVVFLPEKLLLRHVVDLFSENIFNRILLPEVTPPTIGVQLKAVWHTFFDLSEECVCCFSRALPGDGMNDEASLRIHSQERVLRAEIGIVVGIVKFPNHAKVI